jgi:diacylglycerol kinase (ATP)
MLKHLVFIVNPFSGTSDKSKVSHLLEEYLDKDKFTYEINYTEYPMHAQEIIKQRLGDQQVFAFIAVGGDGTVNEVASKIIGTHQNLGVLPQGSGNGFGTAIGMNRDLKKSIELLNNCQISCIDTGRCNEETFVNICGIGFDAQIVYMTKSDSKRGFFKYLFTTLAQSIKYKPLLARIYLDGQLKYEGRYAAVVIANGSTYGYDFKIAPSAKFSDGLFDLVLIKDEPIYKYFYHIPKYFNGGIKDLDFVINEKVENIKVEVEGENYYHLDGEGKKGTKIYEFFLNKSSLNVLIPKA